MRKIIVFTAISLCLAAFFSAGERITQVINNINNSPCVVVDPGHGGPDGGAVGISGIEEKELNLQIACRLNDMLGLFGVHSVMTRYDDTSIHESSAKSIRAKKISDIKNRVAMIEDISNARLISIHMNHFSSASCKGAQVFYSKGYEKFAKTVQYTLCNGLDPENARVATVAPNSIYLLSQVNCPAILVECGFLSNPMEEIALTTDEYQKRVALCIATGYLDAEKMGM